MENIELSEEQLAKDITQVINAFNQQDINSCQKLADKNDPDGIYYFLRYYYEYAPDGMYCWLGYCYEHGIGVKKDETMAFNYYQKSADLINPNGMYQVGYCYYLGIGVEIDKYKAFEYYLKSAEADNSMGIRKTAICYHYGIGVEKNKDKFLEWIKKDPYSYKVVRIVVDRKSKYGKCASCNEDNTQPAWCLSCDPDITTRWASGNKDIDICMKMFQLRNWKYENVIEWIPFDRLSDIKKVGKGGFGSVYSAIWLDGIRKVEKIDSNHYYKKSRKSNSTVALKTLTSSKKNNFDPLKEFKSLMTCKMQYYNTKLAIYGITQNTESNKYFIVFQYANNGSLYKYLRNNFYRITWQAKLQILKDISEELDRIHTDAKYIHADFHSGNILQDQYNNENISYIADLGLSRRLDESVSKGEIYGVMPYVAPEVLSGEQQFTEKADIYGFGIIMTEMSTGQRPFDGHMFNARLAVKIIKGERPEIAPETPECYIELAKQCMDSDLQKRPSAWDIYETIEAWLNDDEIKKQFLNADKVIKSLPISKHLDEMYTSKLISTKLISNTIKDLSQADSSQIKFDITES